MDLFCRRHAAEHERCEEDFYYTEVNQWEPPLSLPLSCGPAPISPSSSSAPSSPPSPPPPAPPSPTSPALSRSAPSSSGIFWQVQSEHSYQVRGPVKHGSPVNDILRSTTFCVYVICVYKLNCLTQYFPLFDRLLPLVTWPQHLTSVQWLHPPAATDK